MPHPTLTLLSEYVEDVVPGPERTAVEDHLRHCADCRAAVEELDGVRTALGRAPVPPMPSAVADRLEAAIAEEAEHRAPETHVHSIARARHRQTRRPRVLRRALTAVAAVAILGTGGAVAFQVIGTPDRPPTAGSQADKPRRTPPSSYTLSSKGIDLTSKSFASEVEKAVKPAKPASKAPKQPSASKSSVTGMNPPPSKRPRPEANAPLELCVDQALPRGVVRKMMDSGAATFEGKSATLVIAKGSKPGAIQAYVVTGCPDTGRIVHQQEILVSR